MIYWMLRYGNLAILRRASPHGEKFENITDKTSSNSFHRA